MLVCAKQWVGPGVRAHPIKHSSDDPALMRHPTSLPVCLNGERDYVQGTQMVARSAEILEECFGAEPVLISTAFHKITDRKVAGCTDESQVTEATALGDIVFNFDADRTAKLFLIELPETAPHDVVPVRCRYEFVETVDGDPWSANFRISELESGEDLLIALVQSLKQLHEMAEPKASNVWFTGLRAGRIPMRKELTGLGSCRLELRPFRRLPGKAGWQSMTSATVIDEGGNTAAEAVMSFAYKLRDPN